MHTGKNEFYIGWMASAPGGIAKHIRKVLYLLVAIVLLTGVILALQQKKFSTATFEYGQLTEVRGVYQTFPVPSIKMPSSQYAFGHTTYLTMPLVGYGKFGAEGIIAQLEKEKGIKLDGRECSLKGTLLYSDGKALLQIDQQDTPLVRLYTPMPAGSIPSHEIKELGNVELKGEILDPKCYFGVMKPGSGQPHRDCAIRCIEGGMSPVLAVQDSLGHSGYYLLLDENGKKMNDVLKDYIAEPVSLRARAVQYDDWIVLYIKGRENIHRISGLSLAKGDAILRSCAK